MKKKQSFEATDSEAKAYQSTGNSSFNNISYKELYCITH